jgi:hypothetical protein
MQIFRVCRKELLQCSGSNLTLSFQADKPWDPDPSKGLDLAQFSGFVFCFLKFGSHILVFSQGITQGDTQGDTLRGSDQDAWMMCKGVCDTRPTLVIPCSFGNYRALFGSLMRHNGGGLVRSTRPNLGRCQNLLSTRPFWKSIWQLCTFTWPLCKSIWR